VCFISILITGPPTHSKGASIVFLAAVCRWRRLSSSFVCNIPHKQRNWPGGSARRPVVLGLRPVRATPCFVLIAPY